MSDESNEIIAYRFNLKEFMTQPNRNNFDGFIDYLLEAVESTPKSKIFKDLIDGIKSYKVVVYDITTSHMPLPGNPIGPIGAMMDTKQRISDQKMFTLIVSNGKEIDSNTELFKRMFKVVDDLKIDFCKFQIR